MPRGKKRRGQKSAAIRQLLEQNPDRPVGEIVSELKGRGIKVLSNMVYTLRGKMKSGRKRGRATATHANANGAADAVTLVRGVKDLAVQAGGLKQLKVLVDVMAEDNR
jgi:hypothetical protein